MRVKLPMQQPADKGKRTRRAVQKKNRVQTKKNYESRSNQEVSTIIAAYVHLLLLHIHIFFFDGNRLLFFLYKLCVCNMYVCSWLNNCLQTTNEVVLDYFNLSEITGGRLLDIFGTKKGNVIGFNSFIIGLARVIKKIIIFSFSQ
ncbi:hypothetical protein RFI_37242 [Reticulomyxa filosa]|uniref:Uncharacterized protein n=1 Tax=Reticulomyxa filosa TaxID=46433 RepID=X6LHK0_RETFI|nr:hypothetical protein RFI_37242 [Reticulomyxa filosa]|eukprot:ETO00205.1 hypothetical protein RFI_37242 [Reticulomyxa filosa]